MKGFISVWSVVLAMFLASRAVAASPETKPSSYQLQYEFSRATDLRIQQRWQDVAGDSAAALRYVGASFLLNKPGFSNLGEEWSTSDYIVGSQPRALHLFTAYSNQISGSIFMVGGREISLFALVARRGNDEFCVFKLPQLSIINLRLAVVQEFLNPDRDETLGKFAQCQWQSPRQPLVLPRD